jgi:hypothetical protein
MDPNKALLFAKINLIASVILAVVTAWYAISTHKILKEMKHQSDLTVEQSIIHAKSVQVSILAALTNAAGDTPIPKLRSMLKEFETFLAELEKNAAGM